MRYMQNVVVFITCYERRFVCVRPYCAHSTFTANSFSQHFMPNIALISISNSNNNKMNENGEMHSVVP